jgi:hypothetical protein
LIVAEEEVTPAHVYARMTSVLDAIELIRLEMGRPRDVRRNLRVENAAPREVFFEARAMLHKAHRLHHELTGEGKGAGLAGELAAAVPAEVMILVARTLELLEAIKRRLGISETLREQPAPGMQPSDVLGAVLRASRQLNLLLARPFAPADALGQVDAAVARTEELLGRFDAALPPTPPHEPRKTPAEVYRVLWSCFATLREILELVGLVALDLRQSFAGEEPGDVYDLASLLMSELVHLESQVPRARSSASPARDVHAPVLPAHVHRRARQLQAALILLRELARQQPGRIRPGW